MRWCLGAWVVLALAGCGGADDVQILFVSGDGSTFVRIGDFEPEQTVDLEGGAVRQTTLGVDPDDRITSFPQTARVDGTLRLRLDDREAVRAVRVTAGGRSVAIDSADGSSSRTRFAADGAYDHFVRRDAAGTAVIDVVRPGVLGLDHMVYGYWEQVTVGLEGFTGAGAFGAPTARADVPTDGTARYSGGSIGVVVDAAGASRRLSSTVVLNADFAAGRVAFASTQPIDPSSGQAFDAFAVSGALTISGSSFRGTGSTASGWSGPIDGRFFGPSAREAGGAFDLSGSGTERYVAGFGARR